MSTRTDPNADPTTTDVPDDFFDAPWDEVPPEVRNPTAPKYEYRYDPITKSQILMPVSDIRDPYTGTPTRSTPYDPRNVSPVQRLALEEQQRQEAARQAAATPPVVPPPPAPTTQTRDYGDDSAFAQQIRDAVIKSYGGYPPNQQFVDSQVDYFIQKRHAGETTGSGAPADDSYWVMRASGAALDDSTSGHPMAGRGAANGGGLATGGQYGGQYGSTGGYAINGLPPGYSTGTFTGGGKYPLASVMGPGLMSPFTAAFQNPGNFQSPGDFQSPGNFVRPTIDDMKADPGYQARLDAGTQAIDRGAAAKGTLRNPGTLKDLNQWSQDYAANEYANTYNRALGENNLTYGRALDENNLAYNRALNENNTDYNRAWTEYTGAYNIYDRNQANQFNRLQTVSGMGQNAAGATGTLGARYGDQLGQTNATGAQLAANNAQNTANRNNSFWTNVFNTGLDFTGDVLF